MHSVLIIVDKPADAETEANQAWLAFQKKLSEISKQDVGPQRLDENSVLINVHNELPAFGSLLTVLNDKKLSHRVLFFEKEPEWIQYNP